MSMAASVTEEAKPCSFIKTVLLASVFFCEFYENFKNIRFCVSKQ